MFAKLKSLALKKADNIMAVAVGSTAGLSVIGITASGGVVHFEQADKDAIGQGFANGIANLWAGFTTLLPYIGMAVGIGLVIGLAFKLIFKRG